MLRFLFRSPTYKAAVLFFQTSNGVAQYRYAGHCHHRTCAINVYTHVAGTPESPAIGRQLAFKSPVGYYCQAHKPDA